jgi:hypothetical protein
LFIDLVRKNRKRSAREEEKFWTGCETGAGKILVEKIIKIKKSLALWLINLYI